ncbi:TPA: RNA-directed DNA polymerase [Morganella morganii]|nr:RNA-directed DNA polymerase [Morganella morganii]HEI7945977.1 RNA-directed DNA polymerase [Morganella morganii]
MIRQDFSIKSLLKVTCRHEIIKFSLGRNKDEYKSNLEPISTILSDKDFNFKFIKSIKIRGKNVYFTDNPSEHFALKIISYNINRLYKISLNNRDEISEQIAKILETSSCYGVIKLDVKHFYESISFDNLIDKLKTDMLLSARLINILGSLKLLGAKGLPRGLSISPILSEIFMKNVDSAIKNIPGVYYYSRYVDDIFILSTKNSTEIYCEVIKILDKYELKTNKKMYKTDIFNTYTPNISNKTFDHLGYKYIIKNTEYNNKRIVNIELADDKVRKIKTRIVHSLLDRVHNKSRINDKKELLLKRINILSGNYPLFSKGKTNQKETQLKGGIYFSNRLVNNPAIFEQFNSFIKKSIFSRKNNFFGRTMNKIPLSEKIELIHICFRQGFVQKKFIPSSDKEMKEIKECWKHKNHKRK